MNIKILVVLQSAVQGLGEVDKQLQQKYPQSPTADGVLFLLPRSNSSPTASLHTLGPALQGGRVAPWRGRSLFAARIREATVYRKLMEIPRSTDETKRDRRSGTRRGSRHGHNQLSTVWTFVGLWLRQAMRRSVIGKARPRDN